MAATLAGRLGIPAMERRQYVTVDTIQRWKPGALPVTLPHRVHWYDGRSWEVSRIVSRQNCGSEETDTLVTRWNVLLGHVPKTLWHDSGGWFVIPKHPIGRMP